MTLKKEIKDKVARRVRYRKRPVPNKKSEYKVGYSNPPKEHQFKKGQSGNPKGRPKGRKPKPKKNIMTVIFEKLHEQTVLVKTPEGYKEIPCYEAVAETFFQKAIKDRDYRALKLLMAVDKAGIKQQNMKLEDNGAGLAQAMIYGMFSGDSAYLDEYYETEDNPEVYIDDIGD